MKNYLLLCLVVALGMPATYAAEIPVFAGAEGKTYCPVIVSVDNTDYAPGAVVSLIHEDETLAGQIFEDDEGKHLAFIIPRMEPYEKRVYTVSTQKASSENPVSVAQDGNELLVQVGGKQFTRYIYQSDELPRPIFYPVIGPNGARMTRGYPMDPKPGERQDHPHHQSLWVSHGNVNGYNFWHLSDNDDQQDKQIHQNFNSIISGPVMGRIDSNIQWVTHEGDALIDEHRVVTIWGTPERGRLIDFNITFTPSDGDVSFNDTKEGGLISLRIASSMDESQRDDSKQGGLIVNANGQRTESNAWGKAARWCDYSGPVDGIIAGVTIMDHPSNPFYPTRYHVRGYGLFTANPFGLSHFIGGDHDGTTVLKKGESWELSYRLYFHAGDSDEANVADIYEDFADGVQIFK